MKNTRKVIYKDTFLFRLEEQLDYLESKSYVVALNFHNKLFSEINRISLNPLQCRKSIYFNSELIRDLVFDGYTIVFIVYDDRIEIIGLIKYQNSPY